MWGSRVRPDKPQWQCRGQAILEYALVIGTATAVLVTMSNYMKRSIQASIKMAADDVGDQGEGLRHETADKNNGASVVVGEVLERTSTNLTDTDSQIRKVTSRGGAVQTVFVKDQTETTGRTRIRVKQ